jgi:hypothetical protein
MLKLIVILLSLLPIQLKAEVIYLKDLEIYDQEPNKRATNISSETKNMIKDQASTEIARINSFFNTLETEYPGIGPFVFLEDKILMSKINQNIEKISPQITQFKPFTIFTMDKMESIFAEIKLYLKDNYEQKNQEIAP